MPIIVTPTTAPGKTPQISAPRVNRSTPQWRWNAPSGTVRSLTSDQPYLRPGGVIGHLAAPVTLIQSLPPTMDGGMYRSMKVEPRDIGLGMIGVGADPSEWQNMQRQLAADFDTTTADGVLEVNHPDGETRLLACRYNGGLESPEGGDPGAVFVAPFTIQLRAYDPWWYGPMVSYPWRFASPQDFIPDGVGAPPFYISPVRLGGVPVGVVNAGDVEAFPVWTLTGPMTAADLTEHGSARSLTVSVDLAAGEQLTIDTSPRVPAPDKITQSGVSVWGVATGDYPDLWPLPAGDSSVSVTVAGSTDDTRVVMQFNPRYRTA